LECILQKHHKGGYFKRKRYSILFLIVKLVLNKLKKLREVIIEVIDKRIENFDQNEKEGNDDMHSRNE
jgi:hypothetical protein